MRLVVWQSAITSVLMGFYIHGIFWWPQFRAETFFGAVAYIAMPAKLYIFSQALPVSMRPQMAVWLLFADWAASIFPIAETYFVFFRTLIGSYHPTTFQWGALAVFTLTESVDLLFFVISSLLLRRSIGVVT